MKVGSEQIRLRSFAQVALAWMVLGCVGTAVGGTPPGRQVFWFLAYWTMCVFGLFSLAKTIAVTLSFMFHQGAENRLVYGMQSAFWGSLKLTGFAAFGLLFYLGRREPGPALYFGLATLVIVPVFGGWLWGRREIPDDARGEGSAEVFPPTR